MSINYLHNKAIASHNYLLACKQGNCADLNTLKTDLASAIEFLDGSKAANPNILPHIEHDISILSQTKAQIEKLEATMHQFYLQHSAEQAKKLLEEFARTKALIEANLEVVRIPQFTQDLRQQYNNNYLPMHNYFTEYLSFYTDHTEGKESWYSSFMTFMYKDLLVETAQHRLFKKHLHYRFSQSENELIGSHDGGFCFGINLGVSWDLLTTENDMDLTTISELENNLLGKISLYQNSIHSVSNPPAVLDLEEWQIKRQAQLKVFVHEFDGQYMSASEFAENIGTTAAHFINKLKPTDVYAFNLLMRPINNSYMAGHAMDIVFVRGRIYFVDPNKGIFKFANGSELKEFLSWYLSVNYTQYYSTYSLSNYPHLETDFKIPQGLQNHVLPKERCDLQINNSFYSYMWDMMYDYGTIALELADSLRLKASSSIFSGPQP